MPLSRALPNPLVLPRNTNANGWSLNTLDSEGIGGSITMIGGLGGNAGSINTSGTNNGAGGSIDTSSSGGSINLSNGGGSINLSNGGGSINTTEGGSINTTEGGSINTSMTGGSIDTSQNGGSINTFGHNNGGVGGSISTNAGTGEGGSGGSIDTSGGNDSGGIGGSINMRGANEDTGVGGSIDTSASGSSNGGSINTSAGGGSINTQGVGSIELGVTGTRTTLNGSATADRTATLPNITGTLPIALISASTALNFGSVGSSGGFADLTITLAGAATTDVVFVTCLATAGRGATDGKLIFEAFVSSANTVTVRAHNPTSGSIDPASYNFKVAIIKTA